FAGDLLVRARQHLYEDGWVKLKAGATSVLKQDFRLKLFDNAMALSDSLTASAHIGEVKWPDKESRAAFISQCNYCHQIGNSLTRVPRSVSAWQGVIERMEGYGVLLTRDEAGTIAEQLHEGLDGKPVAS